MASHGVSGRLLSRQFMREMWRLFDGHLGESTADAARRRLERWRRTVDATLGPASGLTTIHDVAARELFRVLGFELTRAGATAGALLSIASARGTGPLPLVVGVWTDRLDALTRRALHEAIAHGGRWAFCFNGHALRLVDADRPYARRVLDFDLAALTTNADIVRVLWATSRSAAFDRRSSTRDTALSAIVAASDSHAGRVANSLQHGVRTALEALAHALRRAESRRRTSPDAIVEQSLTIVYRLLFLLFAEARALVPVWNPIYRDSYSIDGLRGSCDRVADTVGLWEAIQAISRLAHAGCATRDLHVTAFNSQLFSPERTPLVERAQIDDETMASALRALTDTASQGGSAGVQETTRIAYGDLGVEQLGSIYERLLDVTPTLEIALAAPARRSREPSAPTSTVTPLRTTRQPSRTRLSARRKESGTFYTPRSMAEHLVRETLEPLVRDKTSEQILSLRVLDPAMGSGAFLVAACRFFAEACLNAQHRDGDGGRGTDAQERARLRRLTAQRCLYGVDLNPAAVQLARLSLWLATLAADAPLTFLDHHVCAGDSLVGASIDDLLRGWPVAPRAPRPHDAREPSLFETDAVTTLMHETMPLRHRLAGPDDSAETVRAKEQSLARSLGEGALARWMALADLWCARWFWTGEPGPPPAPAWRALVDQLLHGASTLPAHIGDPMLRHAREIAGRRRFLHWSLRFPEVFYDVDGQPRPDAGFDAIVGNPPWDMVRGDAREAALRDEGRTASIALGRFVRDSRLYHGSRDAHLNRYQLFTERALALTRPGGRIGLVVPWGVASDVASAPLRRLLFERCDTDTLIGFENSDGVFPIHRSVRFALVVTTAGRPTERIACRLGERTLDVLEGRRELSTTGDAARIVLTPAWLRRVSGDGLEVPWVRSARDVALVDRLHARWPALGAVDGWAVTFGRELNATDDRALFESFDPSPRPSPGKRGEGVIPVIDGKHVTPFAVHVDRSERVVPTSRAAALARRLPSTMRQRLGYRDVASPGNRVTLIAAVLPPHVVSTHTLFCLKSPLDDDSQYVLCALMNSLVANYLVRLRVTTHVTVSLVSRLPMPTLVRGSARFEALATGARELESQARTIAADGRPLSAGAFERSATWSHVQALAAHAWDLTPTELEHVLSTFPLVDAVARQALVSAFERGP